MMYDMVWYMIWCDI